MSDTWASYFTKVTGAVFSDPIDSSWLEGGYNRWETSAA